MDKARIENLFDELYPLPRSITGAGLRQSLEILGREIPLQIIEYPTGMKCFDWEVPHEWNVRDAYIKRTNGEPIADFTVCNLHLMGYSIPFSGRISLDELKKHILTIPTKPDAIPFATSYYNRRWGFCIPHRVLESMNDKEYDVLIDSTLEAGSTTLGELFIEGSSKKEILLFSHIGHPSMANDQLSGPLTATAVGKWLMDKQDNLKYSYRIILSPETIGTIAYISKNLAHLKKRVIGGFTIACTADKGSFNYRFAKGVPTIADRAMENALAHCGEKYSLHPFSPTGCDERHFNSPGVGIGIGSIMRSMPGTYPEYHTSLDNKAFISFDKLMQSIGLVKNAIQNIEADARVRHIHRHCEPKLDRHGLYPTLSNKTEAADEASCLLSLWAYADGSSLSEIAGRIGTTTSELRKCAEKLADKKIIKIKEI